MPAPRHAAGIACQLYLSFKRDSYNFKVHSDNGYQG